MALASKGKTGTGHQVNPSTPEQHRPLQDDANPSGIQSRNLKMSTEVANIETAHCDGTNREGRADWIHRPSGEYRWEALELQPDCPVQLGFQREFQRTRKKGSSRLFILSCRSNGNPSGYPSLFVSRTLATELSAWGPHIILLLSYSTCIHGCTITCLLYNQSNVSQHSEYTCQGRRYNVFSGVRLRLYRVQVRFSGRIKANQGLFSHLQKFFD